MSIADQITRIQNEVNNQTDMIAEIDSIIDILPNKPTCTIRVVLPAATCVFYWGESLLYFNGSLSGSYTAPSEIPNTHAASIATERVFENIPLGSVLTFYHPQQIVGATVDGAIEFGLTNYGFEETTKYNFAICRCNGSGTITINI